MRPLVNHGIPEPGFNLGGNDVFWCFTCRAEIHVAWAEFEKFRDPILTVGCPFCGVQDQFAFSFLDPKVDDSRRWWGEKKLFGAPGAQILGGRDVVICPKCFTRSNIQWEEFPDPTPIFTCSGCQEKSRLMMSAKGRAFRNFSLKV